MELFELILILLACVIASSILDQVISRMSLPLLQIAVGLVLAIFLPRMAEVHVDEELFMVLFIAPMLFREAKETDRKALWSNKWAVLSMAIALVIVTVLAAGYVMHWIVPSIPLAAAFACAAALGPTDAAAVSALGSTITLTKRQQTLLSGEALINDASGVVSFQFAIAAAVTGAFSAAEAVGSFLILFFGGIAFGIVLGFLASAAMIFLRRRGLVSTIVHVLYEVLTPFVFYLFAEAIGVSGILTVVAAGLVMQEPKSAHLITSDMARQNMVSDSFWEVIIFLINGVIFVMLGMQLPTVMQTEDMEGVSAAVAILTILAVTGTILGIRFVWLMVMEKIHRYQEKKAGNPDECSGGCIRQALVTTIAGPKGAVTLSIILTIPLFMNDGSAFPHRDLIIFLTSGIILCTLLLADFALPRLAPQEKEEGGEEELLQAKIQVLEGTVQALREQIDEYPDSEFVPAERLVLMRYRVRLMRRRFSSQENGDLMQQLVMEVLHVQQEKLEEIRERKKKQGNLESEDPLYNEILGKIRSTVGYFDGGESFEYKGKPKRRRLFRQIPKLLKKYVFRFRKKEIDQERISRLYYDASLTAIELEEAAIAYLKDVRKCDNPERVQAAKILFGEHNASLRSLKSRICVENDRNLQPRYDSYDSMPEEIRVNMHEQFETARRYADEAETNALNLELEQIQRLRRKGTITEEQARSLREEVYLLQMSFLEEE